MKRLFIITLTAVIILGILTSPALAEVKKIDGDRLERGGKNLALGWTEIPNGIVNVTRDTNNPFLGLTVGLVKGVFNAFARTTSGVADVVTSPARPKAQGEIMKPEMARVSGTK